MSNLHLNGDGFENHDKTIEKSIENLNSLNDQNTNILQDPLSSNAISTSVKHTKLPTPEEFIKLFCQSSTTKNSIIDTGHLTEHHSQMFRVHNVKVTVDSFHNQLENDSKSLKGTKTEIEFYKSDKCIQKTSKLPSIYSGSFPFESYQLNFIKLPSKRKATWEIYIGKKCKTYQSNYAFKLTSLHCARKECIINFEYENTEILIEETIHCQSIIEVICPETVLFRCSEFSIRTPFYLSASINRYLTNIVSKENGIVEPSSDLSCSCPVSQIKLSTWDTKTTIKVFQSIYLKLLIDFNELSDIFGNNFYEFIIDCTFQILSKTKPTSFQTLKDAKINYFPNFAAHALSDSNRGRLEKFEKKIRQILQKHLKTLSKLKLFRLIIFVVYLMKFRKIVPKNSLKISKWKTVLRLFCQFECQFFKFHCQWKMGKCHSGKFSEKNRILYKNLFKKLLIGKTLKNKRLASNIYECQCGEIFDNFRDSIKHLKRRETHKKTELKFPTDHQKNTEWSKPCEMTKHEILSRVLKVSKK